MKNKLSKWEALYVVTEASKDVAGFLSKFGDKSEYSATAVKKWVKK